MRRKNSRTKRIACAALAIGAATAWHIAASRIKRQRLLDQGEISALRSRWFDVNGMRVHARYSAAAATQATVPLICIHGWGVSGAYFISTAERLATGFPVYVPDLPGHGLSNTPPKALDIPELAQALIDWMDTAGISRATLVGQSMGCQVAVEAAIAHPARIERLVLIGPAPGPPDRGSAEQLARLLLGTPYERLSIIRHVVADYVRMGLRLLPEFRFMMRHPFERKLVDVNIPTLLVHGEKDWITPQWWIDRLAILLRTDRTEVIAGSAHAVHYSAPAEVAEKIRHFIGGADQSGDSRHFIDTPASEKTFRNFNQSDPSE